MSTNGWKMVPVEPTPEMVNAGGFADTEATDSYTGDFTHCIGDSAAREAYRDMLAAAPPAPAAGGGEVVAVKLCQSTIARLVIQTGLGGSGAVCWPDGTDEFARAVERAVLEANGLKVPT